MNERTLRANSHTLCYSALLTLEAMLPHIKPMQVYSLESLGHLKVFSSILTRFANVILMILNNEFGFIPIARCLSIVVI